MIAGDGPLREELEDRARELGILDRTTFCGTIDDFGFRELLERAAVFVLPCRIAADGDRDGIPLVLMEAMATGVPVVSTEVSGIPELVQHEVTGLLAPPESASHVQKCIEQILAWPDQAHRLSSAGRAFVRKRFNISCTARSLLELLRVSRMSAAR